MSTLLELLGAVSVTVGCALLAPWLAFLVGGLMLVMIGFSLDTPRKSE